ncbi:MAG: T9SS type A sorting domain-containing protein [Salibacteraceae bacterium]
MNRNNRLGKRRIRRSHVFQMLLLALFSWTFTSVQAQVPFFSPINPMPAQTLQVVVPVNGNPISIHNVKGPENKRCGGYLWRVNFSLESSSAAGGWIVQELKGAFKIDNCDGTNKETTNYHFWEAWRIAAGDSIDTLRKAGTFTYDDQYSEPSHPNTKGTIKVTGKVKFFEGVNLPPTMMPNNPNTIAGGLPSDTAKPSFWNETGAKDHNLCVNWDCCNNNKIDTLITVHEDTTTTIIGDGKPEVTHPPKVVDDKDPVIVDDEEKGKTGKDSDPYTIKTPRIAVANDPIVRMIRMLPAWTEPINDKEQQTIKSIVAELALLSDDQLRGAIAKHHQYYRDAGNNLEELSKDYLLLRMIFDLPEAFDRSQVKNFGGWVHPSVFHQEAYNLSWPIAQTEGGLQVAGKYMGFNGRGYDPVGEFDFFAGRFQRRTPEAIAPQAAAEDGLIVTMIPNPANDFVVLSTPEALNQVVTIEVINQSGFRVASEKVEFGQEFRLNISQLEVGIHFVIFTTEAEAQTVKTLVIQR